VTMRSIFAAAALAVGLAVPAGATTVYENTPVPQSLVCCLGLPATNGNGLWGQSFSAPGGNLQSFTLRVVAPFFFGSVTLSFNISPWDGDSITPGSSPLFTSVPVTLNAGNGGQDLAFSALDLALAAGQHFIAYLRVSSVVDGGVGLLAFANDDSGLGGGLWISGTPSLLEDPWTPGGGIPHLYHRAVFADPAVAVPAPAAMSLLGLGVLGLVALRRRA
jgi:hypothetical protein